MKVEFLDNVHEHLGYSPQAQNLFSYLKELCTRTVIVEEEYVDKDYLIDYSKFYARSFTVYRKFTKRLHFFSQVFSQEDFEKLLKDGPNDSNKITNSYLGFIVVKPIYIGGEPLIGRTVLKPPDEESRFCTFIKPKSSASLYGIELTVDSLPFQVQDGAVGACATAALWVSMHSLHNLFDISLHSPAEITEKSVLYPTIYRSFPSEGLSYEQMITYIKSIGLDAESININPKKESIVPDAIRAYIESGIAPIAALKIEKKSGVVELHAVVISGYRCDSNGVIKELYVHDDQIGPYTRVKSDRKFAEWRNEWTTKYGYRKASLEKLLVPVYPKIRLTFGRIYEVYLTERKYCPKEFEVVLFLTQVKEYKKFLWKYLIEDKIKVLITSLPRFLWVIRFHYRGAPVMDDVYDGTSVFPKRLLTIRFGQY